MKLLEYEGKALLAAHGVPVARGALWPNVRRITRRLGCEGSGSVGRTR